MLVAGLLRAAQLKMVPCRWRATRSPEIDRLWPLAFDETDETISISRTQRLLPALRPLGQSGPGGSDSTPFAKGLNRGRGLASNRDSDTPALRPLYGVPPRPPGIPQGASCPSLTRREGLAESSPRRQVGSARSLWWSGGNVARQRVRSLHQLICEQGVTNARSHR
jgi:hypothetical protein